ncbi:hypothetical protein BTH42_27925 [Burkholderia sp. SRS-W-2-2016]|uniref:hypothetical protein n=1 Tax=Burkholderia sp. SRS-W-2-2016 TaxID=1926878 RepID=UPI00094B3E31|nr:hypothetical protein [Burkholderia sp. SRS-W-2-2016]OLL28366.1 hypothetical protein BTH42_27925 [Burkholderia sp. SRS-W-2-2016]
MHPARIAGVFLLATAAWASGDAWANDIQCATTRQPAERVICDHAILNNQYDDIFAQQQALVSSGRLAPAQLAAWRQARNACVDVHCVDGVFAQWKSIAGSLEGVAQAIPPVAAASGTALAPVGPNPDAPPQIAASEPAAAVAVPTSEASLVRQGSAAGVALPQPVVQDASAPLAASAASAPSAADDSRRTTGMSVGLMLALAVAVFGTAFARRRKSAARSGNASTNTRKDPR